MSDNVRQLWLIGQTTPKLTTSKLPTKKCVLKVLMYQLSIQNNFKKRAAIVALQLKHLWNTNGLPTSEKVFNRIKSLYEKYQLLKKNKHRLTKTEEIKVTNFKEDLRKLFDIADAKFDDNVSSDKIKDFLKDQRNG